jgi:phytol kinase
MINNHWIALGLTLVLALVWLRVNDFAAQRGWVESSLSRKIIHTGTGPIFVLCWLLFPNAPADRFIAAIVPLGITLQFFLVGVGAIKDQGAVDGMSRSGDRREILHGPLYYGIVFILLTTLFWYDSPIGITALMLLCGGDGLADIFGKRFPMRPLPWSKDKSWGGTLAMFFGGAIFSIAVLAIMTAAGVLPGPISGYLLPVGVISLAGALVESLPVKDIDNITVPLIAVVLGFLLF